MSLRISLVHSCHDQSTGCPRPLNCKCKYRVTKQEAEELVGQGLASWLIVDWKKTSDGQSVPVTSWNLVWGSKHEEEPGAAVRSALAMKTPRVQTVERPHIERATDTLCRNPEGKWVFENGKTPEDADRIEIWGELAREVITNLIVPFIPDPYGHGRPILVNFNDERSAKGKDIIRVSQTVEIRVDKTESVA